jgi:hypothetical protein
LNVVPNQVNQTKPLGKSKANKNSGGMMLNGSGVTNLWINDGTEQVVEHIEIGLQVMALTVSMSHMSIQTSCNKLILTNAIGVMLKQAQCTPVSAVKTKQVREMKIGAAVM